MISTTSEAVIEKEGIDAGTRPRVLVADADQSFRHQVARLARALGMEADECATASAMLSHLLQRRGPAVVILNIHELETEGKRVIPPLSHQPEHTVILISDLGTPPVLVATQIGAARHLNVTAVLEKPVDDCELRAILRRCGR